MLSIPTDVQAAIEGGRFTLRYLIRFDLDSGSAGIWNDTYTLNYEGVSYGPLGGNMAFDKIPGSTGFDSERVVVTVANLKPEVTGIIQAQAWHQRPCILFVAFIGDDGLPFYVRERFAGFLDSIEISDADQDACVVAMSIESNNRELNRATGRRRSDSDQRSVSANDGFFKHTANAAADTNIYWGRKGPQRPVK